MFALVRVSYNYETHLYINSAEELSSMVLNRDVQSIIMFTGIVVIIIYILIKREYLLEIQILITKMQMESNLCLFILLLSSCSKKTPDENDKMSLSLSNSDPSPSVSAEDILEDDPPPSIFVDGELYIFFDTEKGSRMNVDELEYLGSVIAVTDKEKDGSLIPKEDFYSSSFPVGTEIYRIDEESLYIEYTLYDTNGKIQGVILRNWLQRRIIY